MAPLTNDRSHRHPGRNWNDGFVAQRLLGLMVAVLLAGTILGSKALVSLLVG